MLSPMEPNIPPVMKPSKAPLASALAGLAAVGGGKPSKGPLLESGASNKELLASGGSNKEPLDLPGRTGDSAFTLLLTLGFSVGGEASATVPSSAGVFSLVFRRAAFGAGETEELEAATPDGSAGGAAAPPPSFGALALDRRTRGASGAGARLSGKRDPRVISLGAGVVSASSLGLAERRENLLGAASAGAAASPSRAGMSEPRDRTGASS